MLILARMTPEQNVLTEQNVRIFPIVEDVAAELSHLAVAKNIELTLIGENHLTINASPTILAILVRNLIHNAIVYTKVKGEIKIEILQENNRPVIQITDSGPGIDEALLERVFDRFYRVAGSYTDGCGLGLAIAKECADKLHAQLSLSNTKPHGLVAKISF